MAYKKYKDTKVVEAVFYDGTYQSAEEVVRFGFLKNGKKRAYIEKNWYDAKSKHRLYIHNVFWGVDRIIKVPEKCYVVKYASGLYFPMKKTTFEKRFKEVE